MHSLWHGKALAEAWSRGKQPLLHQFQEEPYYKQAYLGSMQYEAVFCNKSYNFSFFGLGQVACFFQNLNVSIIWQVYANLIISCCIIGWY